MLYSNMYLHVAKNVALLIYQVYSSTQLLEVRAALPTPCKGATLTTYYSCIRAIVPIVYLFNSVLHYLDIALQLPIALLIVIEQLYPLRDQIRYCTVGTVRRDYKLLLERELNYRPSFHPLAPRIIKDWKD